MSMGLYSREVVAAWLGKKVEELERMIGEDGFPAVPVPSGQRIRHKFSAEQMVVWLNKRGGVRWTVEQLINELERCAPNPARVAAEETLAKVVAIGALCETAERGLQRGLDVKRVVKAISELADELNQGGCAA